MKYRHPDRSPCVRVSATNVSNAWEIHVADNGMGIAEQHRERIFEVFQRLHTEREYEGIGLGLVGCKKIVERHGGAIRVESEAGQGSTFVLTLPA
jgi:signal transduction histidine kinase